jgi:2-oxoglutarate dehydrogenase E1 component
MRLDQIQGINAGYVAELYERYRENPESIDPASRAVFESWVPADQAQQATGRSDVAINVIVGAANLAECVRRYGHLAAQIDPLGSVPQGDPSLFPKAHGISDGDLRRLPASLVGGPVAATSSSAFDAIEKLRRIYSSTTGFDLAHVFVPEEREWLRDAVESGRYLPPMDAESAHALLDRLTEVEAFEHFLHRVFPGKTRFSIEGLDMLVPVLDEIISGAGDQGVRHTLLGMAHRGRLNVLAHVLDKPYAEILAQFKDSVQRQNVRLDLGWRGDVKYHAGARTSSPRGQMFVTLVPNPSHLEAVNPVVEGMARAAGTRTADPGPPVFAPAVTLPILIHGDTAFPGQGIVAETLNLSGLSGYETGGTIHIIANNQLGFTATPDESFSTSYASGLARGFKIPIVHVNADDPAACLEAARLAWEYRARFHRDFLIDLVGYRRFGHNEGDEPSFTQPLIYQAVSNHPSVRALFADAQERHGQITADQAQALVKKHHAGLEQAYESLNSMEPRPPDIPASPPRGIAARTETAVPIDRLRALNDGLLARPDGFTFHKKLERARERRRLAIGEPGARTIDWATAEELAFATTLADGIPIRLTGEDVERGTFSQRHAVFHDAVSGKRFVPLQSFAAARASFDIHNSPLSENAAIGFEFGYNVYEPGCLVLWEAQYGDFINGAQVMLDEFVTSGRAKWGLMPSLVFLLPHGYEGQGPDHSSARPERILEAAADMNLRLVNCSTSAQYFHVLRRQAALLEDDPLPLFILTPKSLLRHPAVAATPLELAQGRFMPVIDDADARSRARDIKRLVLCSGKVYVDAVTSERRAATTDVALCRLEQLYPFPAEAMQQLIGGYPALEDVAWLQEEPENMGSWGFVRPLLEEVIANRCPLRYIGRARSSSPSEGSAAWHQINQNMLIEQIFDRARQAAEPSMVLSKQA